jgi:MoaA/NifB/PqqE/SkfB family radical SAM enzyme
MKRNSVRYIDAFLSMLRSSLFTHKPFFLAHAITYSCNAKCKTCTYWQISNKEHKDLSTDEVYSLLDKAYDFGMRGYYLFGGEPLVRKDIEAVVEYAKNRGFLTTMNTNASLLEAKADSLGENLDFIFVSLDSFNDYHDFIRGRQGSFAEVMKGIKKISEVGRTRVTLVATISSINLDAIKSLAKLAQDLDVGISYNAVEPTVQLGFDGGRTDSPVKTYGLSEQQLQTFYQTLLALKEEGYPLMETTYVLKHYVQGKNWICHFPKVFVYVSPDNKIFNCTYDHTYDLKNGSFEDYFTSIPYKEHVNKAKKCNICVRTCVRMYSYAYALKPLNFLNLYKDIELLKNHKHANSLTPLSYTALL